MQDPMMKRYVNEIRRLVNAQRRAMSGAPLAPEDQSRPSLADLRRWTTARAADLQDALAGGSAEDVFRAATLVSATAYLAVDTLLGDVEDAT